MTTPSWLTVTRGEAPLIVSLPHTGLHIPLGISTRLVSAWLARKDADWWIDRVYDFAERMGATVIHTGLSRTVIDVNRDPSGQSLYPGRATTELCPLTTFDGEPLYLDGIGPPADEVGARFKTCFLPYHEALGAEIQRLRSRHADVVLYDCHSIRSRIPRLFDGLLPVFNIGTADGASCDGALTRAFERICDATGESRVTDGRFKGGFITRHYGNPGAGVHAIQMELAARAYMDEVPGPVTPESWPVPHEEARAAPVKATLQRLFEAAITFASGAR